jgi:hypothetical protein
MTDAIVLTRAQFAFTLGFHIVLPAFNIGLASYLATLEGLWLTTGREVCIGIYNYWRQLLAADLRRHLRHGRRLRPRPLIRVRHQLGAIFRQNRSNHRAADGVRGADRLLPRGRVSRCHAVRQDARRPKCAFPRHRCCRHWHAVQCVLDPVREFLDANAGWLHDDAGRPLRPGRLVADRLHALLSVPPRAHGARILSCRSRSWLAASPPGICGATGNPRPRA